MNNGLAEQGKELDKLSLWNLRDAYDKYHAVWPKKLAAEVAFALAVAIKRASDSMGEGFRDKKVEYTAMAREYASACIALVRQLPAETLDDVSSAYGVLAGVTIPNYFYLDYLNSAASPYFDADGKLISLPILKRFPEFAALLR